MVDPEVGLHNFLERFRGEDVLSLIELKEHTVLTVNCYNISCIVYFYIICNSKPQKWEISRSILCTHSSILWVLSICCPTGCRIRKQLFYLLQQSIQTTIVYLNCRLLIVVYVTCWASDCTKIVTYKSTFTFGDVMTWKCFLHYWSPMRRLHRSSVDSSHKGSNINADRWRFLLTRTRWWANTRVASDLRHPMTTL